MNEDIKVFGLFGFPLSHSLSPLMHNVALRSLGIPGMYFAFERNRKRFLRLMRSRKKMILDGFNVTIPYKELALPYMDRLDGSAKMTGAVNTVLRTGNRWAGYNTDLDGFRAGLREAKFNPRGKKAVLLGAGGAQRAVLVALAQAGICAVSVYDLVPGKGKAFVNSFRAKFPKVKITLVETAAGIKEELTDADLLVNGTGVGLKKKDCSPIPSAYYPKKRLLVYDLIYKPQEPALLKQARRLGHRTVNGETMLLYQGVRAFEIWTKRKAPVDVMRKALRDGLRGN